MEAPARIVPQGTSDYLEVMTKAVFQAGMSWAVVEAKWDGFREAFDGFDPERVAAYGPDDVERLAADTRIVRNRPKIDATIENAATLQDIVAEHGSVESWLASCGDFEGKVAVLKKRFHFLGEFGAYYLLHVVGEEVPPHEEWMRSRGRA